MITILDWIKRHPVLLILSVLFTFAFVSSAISEPDSAIGAIVALALFLAVFWFIGHYSDSRKSSRSTTNPIVYAPPTQSSPPQVRPGSGIGETASSPRPSPPSSRPQGKPISNQARLSSLPAEVRMGMLNDLDIDEEVGQVLQTSKGTLIASDRAVYLIPSGRRGFDVRRKIPYAQISSVWLTPSKRGGTIAVLVGGSRYETDLVDQVELDQGLRMVEALRVHIHNAKQTELEPATLPNESAYAATANATTPPSTSMSTLSLGDMLAMTPTEFEHLTGRALEAMGYKDMVVQGGSGDLAADLMGRDPQGRTVIVQCKRYAPGNKVGSPALQQFIGMKAVHHRADRGIYVTTADYSQQAIDLAKQHDIVLIDGDDLVKITSLLLAEGRPVASSSSDTGGSALNFCPECGEKLKPAARFCASCGATVS